MRIFYFILLQFCGIHIFAQKNIEYIDLVHFTHTDFGYTDHPALLDDLQKRYVDIAIDACLRSTNDEVPFCWTAEILEPVYQWWKMADEKRREDLLKVVRSGQFDIMGLPFGFSPFLRGDDWRYVSNWISDDLWNKFNIKSAIQNDVNGVTRGCAMSMLDKGIKHLWTGINFHWGGVPFKRPDGFWWKMPDGRKMMVWLSEPYWIGYDMFAGEPWRYNGQSKAAATGVWIPRPGDILSTQKEYLLECHKRVIKNIEKMQEDGYAYDFIVTSFSNQWRIDNDPPFMAISDFVKAWNNLGLKPRINLTTVSKALSKIEKRIGKSLPEYEGEWIDWWAFGQASSPRELNASRDAIRKLRAIHSPVWKSNLSEITQRQIEEIQRKLIRYSEHTYGGNTWLKDDYSSHSLGQLYNIYDLAYTAQAKSEWILSQRIRAEFSEKQAGIWVCNHTSVTYTGWVTFDNRGLRGVEYRSVKDSKGRLFPIYYKDQEAKFWVQNIAGNASKIFLPVKEFYRKNTSNVKVEYNKLKVPIKVIWKNGISIDLSKHCSFYSITVPSHIRREDVQIIREVMDSLKRDQDRSAVFIKNYAVVSDSVILQETEHTLVYKIPITHSCIDKSYVELEIWKDIPQVKSRIRFDKKFSQNPMIFYAQYTLPNYLKKPLTSIGDIPYRPFMDQLLNSNKDFLAIDEWIWYPLSVGGWMWTSKDAALVSFGDYNFIAHRQAPPTNMNDLHVMLYNNFWECNYPSDSPGTMNFEFTVKYFSESLSLNQIKDYSNSLTNSPSVMVNPETRQDSLIIKYLYKNE